MKLLWISLSFKVIFPQGEFFLLKSKYLSLERFLHETSHRNELVSHVTLNCVA